MIEGIPGDAEPDEDGCRTFKAGEYAQVFVESELDIYLATIERAWPLLWDLRTSESKVPSGSRLP
ncbi:hypothetical protein J5X84_38050 [Streptosporangiaceae bacterium NEAU-GS5]|nr:hypothetical protein [Streptosporangiaceae bacterium NEAU-GS5]